MCIERYTHHDGTPMTAREIGAEDAAEFYGDHPGTSSDAKDHCGELAAKLRAGRSGSPDEALINALGRKEVFHMAGGVGDDTDEEWERIGIPFCAGYNEGFIAELESIASEPRCTQYQRQLSGIDAY